MPRLIAVVVLAIRSRRVCTIHAVPCHALLLLLLLHYYYYTTLPCIIIATAMMVHSLGGTGVRREPVNNLQLVDGRNERRLCAAGYTYIYIYIYVHVYVCMYVYIYIYIHTYTYTYIHTYIHIHMYHNIHISASFQALSMKVNRWTEGVRCQRSLQAAAVQNVRVSSCLAQSVGDI